MGHTLMKILRICMHEAHKYLGAIFKLDTIVNIERNVYLSGTFTRSRYKEAQIMRAVFSAAAFFGETDVKTEISDRRMVYIKCKYKSALDENYGTKALPLSRTPVVIV